MLFRSLRLAQLLSNLVDNLLNSPYPMHLVAFEDLLADQPSQLATLLRNIDPEVAELEPLARDPSLAVAITRPPDPWHHQHQAWRSELHRRFEAEGLAAHPNGAACQRYVDILDRWSSH